ncbi:MAG: bifunctional YncE family protein/alkaline phosphatase family protein [Bacteroidetes bacterium]|nr:bifunctional YncE family protein/alkaline phosphatase family protein [Bacteroidota bacterium]
MKKLFFLFLLLLSGLLPVTTIKSQTVAEIESRRILLPNGWGITPVGKSLHLGDLPLNMAVSPSGKMIAVTNNGQSDQTIQLIDVSGQTVLDTIVVGKAWIGLTFSADSKTLYASGGNDNQIMKFDVSNNKLILKDTIVIDKPWPVKVCPAGIAYDDKRQLLYTVTTENNSLYVINTASKKVVNRFGMDGEGYTCLLGPGGNVLYISCWGCGRVLQFDTRTQNFTGSIVVGDHPNDMCLNKTGTTLYVANASDNSVSVIDLIKRKVIETLNAALYPAAPAGSTTNSVALDETGKMLFIANADNNCLAVFNVSTPGKSISKGFIPAGWYPTCVRVVNKTLFIANGKGFSSFANPDGPGPVEKKQAISAHKSDSAKHRKVQYIGGLFRGTMSMMPIPDDKQLSVYSQVVYHNVPYTKDKEMVPGGKPGNPIPMKTGDRSPIRYVFYIIKENRTYDQVLSDVPGGNGDTSLLLFGEKITPNQHALAKEFVLLDNFYCDGEVSADGHNWSMGAYATDFLEKNWPTSYGGRGGSYNSEGTRKIANNKNGFIWDYCKRGNVSYRTYGEFADDYKPNIPALDDHYCKYFTSWDQSVYDTTRVRQWQRDFDSLVAADQLPQLNTLRLINDHTQGLSKGRCTPFAQVADNDLAVGLFIDYLSHSPVWMQSVVFILEDDAQNGPDHVDAHRTTAYLAGGFVTRHLIDHTPYSTSSMVRTIELILGLPPMSQYDAAATPMWRCFSDMPDVTPFTALPAKVDLSERNTAMNRWQKMSEGFDFTKEDRAPEDKLNEVLWIAVKGENSSCPPPVHAAFLKATKEMEDD